MDVLLAIIGLVWGVLSIVLFFKVWGMTDDIRAIKNDYFNEKINATKDSLRKNYVLGNMDIVKKMLLNDFIENIESAYSGMKSSDYKENEKGFYVLVDNTDKNLKESIRPYVEKLQKQFDMIGEKVPEYIKRMETFNDYYCLLVDGESCELKDKTNIESKDVSLLEKTKVGTQGSEIEESDQKSNLTWNRLIFPVVFTFVFLIGVTIFHANYSYADWWVEESTILIPTFVVYVFIILIYFGAIKNKMSVPEKNNKKI